MCYSVGDDRSFWRVYILTFSGVGGSFVDVVFLFLYRGHGYLVDAYKVSFRLKNICIKVIKIPSVMSAAISGNKFCRFQFSRSFENIPCEKFIHSSAAVCDVALGSDPYFENM